MKARREHEKGVRSARGRHDVMMHRMPRLSSTLFKKYSFEKYEVGAFTTNLRSVGV